MSQTISRLAVVLLLMGGVALLVASGRPDGEREVETEQAVTLDQVPAPVRETILNEAGTHAIHEIDEIEAGDRLYYEAEWSEGGMEIEIAVAFDGTLMERSVGDSDEADDSENGENGGNDHGGNDDD